MHLARDKGCCFNFLVRIMWSIPAPQQRAVKLSNALVNTHAFLHVANSWNYSPSCLLNLIIILSWKKRKEALNIVCSSRKRCLSWTSYFATINSARRLLAACVIQFSRTVLSRVLDSRRFCQENSSKIACGEKKTRRFRHFQWKRPFVTFMNCWIWNFRSAQQGGWIWNNCGYYATTSKRGDGCGLLHWLTGLIFMEFRIV